MKQSITLSLSLPEIIFDIQNKTYLTGRSALNGNNFTHIANMQANDDDENASQILRSITIAATRLRNRLAEYLEDGDTGANNDSLTARDSLEFNLRMPSNFNEAVTRTLSQTAHQFIVAAAIADWFAITAKGETADYLPVAEESLKILEEALCKRSRPSRP